MNRFNRTLTRPVIYLSGIAIAVAVAGITALLMMPAPEAAAGIHTLAVPLLAANPASGRDRTCASCGIVQRIRRIDPATGLASYEFTVRMRDGSTRDSTGATRGQWLEGDRVMLIGGTAARALEEGKNPVL